MRRTPLRRLAGGATLALTAGTLTLGVCAPTAHAAPAPGHIAVAAKAKTTQLTESQAGQLAVDLLKSYLKPDAVYEGAAYDTSQHAATVLTNDADLQLGSGITATWSSGTGPIDECSDGTLCTPTTLANGTLYTYEVLGGGGYRFTYVRNDGFVIDIHDTGGYWTETGYTGWWPVEESQGATLVQDPRWDQILNAVPDPKSKTKAPNPKKLTAVQLAQQTLTSYLSPFANVASTTSTATSVTVTTTGGVQTDASTTVTWMTQGTGANQYDRQRDCVSKMDDWWSGATESTLGTGTLCTIGGHGSRVMDYYFTRSDGYVLFVHDVDGLYNGRDGGFAPVPAENISKLLLDPRWDTVVKSLA